MRSCAFCGQTGSLTREHVLGRWIADIGLDYDLVHYQAGPLNRLSRELESGPPFRQTVKDVCASCNSGWMSKLEEVARRVLGPLILGNHGTLEPADLGAVAMWAQKTALVAMLVSSEKDRADGYGLPRSEYGALYRNRDSASPLPTSQFWIGQYTGSSTALLQVTPLIVDLDGVAEPTQPHGYLMTVLLGQLLILGVRFTTPSLYVELESRSGMAGLWPTEGPVHWPAGSAVTDESMPRVAGGRDFRADDTHLGVRPWRPAIELAESRLVGATVELQAICGKHVLYYPAELGVRGRPHAFVTACECGMAYLIETEPDGAHCKAAGSPEAIMARYEALAGVERRISDDDGVFVAKRIELAAPGLR